MPWIMGVDEAGYGPNLGPFVMTSVAVHVPEEHAQANLWQVLNEAVRCTDDDHDDRLLVADSKQVYSPARGLRDLEAGVLAALGPWPHSCIESIKHFVSRVCPCCAEELHEEPWYTGTTALSLANELAQVVAAIARLHGTSARQNVVLGPIRSETVCPARFNQLVHRFGSKGGVLGSALARLLESLTSLDNDNDDVALHIDKHGGRNNYAAMLQNAFPDGLVQAVTEGSERSVYRVHGLPRRVTLTFQPRADQEHFAVALASMVSKYLREILMLEYNRFWQTHVPGLKATAGYPQDAVRYYEQIRPAMHKLGITESTVWRSR